ADRLARRFLVSHVAAPRLLWPTRERLARLSPPALLLALACVAPTTSRAGDGRALNTPGIGSYLESHGRVELKAIAKRGHEGGLDRSGYPVARSRDGSRITAIPEDRAQATADDETWADGFGN